MKTKTTQLASMERGALVHIHAVDGIPVPDGPVAGSAFRVSGQAWGLTLPHSSTEYRDGTKVHVEWSPMGSAAPKCDRHNELRKQRPGGIVFCPSCYRESQKAYRDRKAGKPAQLTADQERQARSASLREQAVADLCDRLAASAARNTQDRLKGVTLLHIRSMPSKPAKGNAPVKGGDTKRALRSVGTFSTNQRVHAHNVVRAFALA